MPYRHVSQGIPKVDYMQDYAAQDWYRKITSKATAISQLDEMALVGAGMSLLWVPKHPLGQPVYSYQGKFGYSLINVLDLKTAGTMVEAIQADGNPTWLDQIRGRFLHPSDESLNRYVAEVLGEDVLNDPVEPGREEVIVLSSESSDQNFEDLTSRCARAGTAQGDAVEPVHEVVGDDDDVEVKPEGKAAGSSRKRPSTHPCLGYVVVSDTLSGLGVGERSQQSDPDDSATLTEHMKKKALEDHKRKLDEQSAALLAAKKAKLHKEAPPAPSESEIDLSVFSGGHGNLLEELYAASAPPTVKIGKKPCAVDISQITPPTSPPPRTVGLTPPRDDVDADTRGDEGFTEGVAEAGVALGGDGGADGGADRGKGIEVEGESNETTPQQTIYTKRPPGGGGATSGVVRSPHIKLDEQSAALLAAKKAKLHKEAPPAPSEIDLSVFSGGRGNLLEELYAASAPPTVKIGKKPCAVDISQITPPTSPPSRTVGLTPPRDDVDADTRGDEGFTEGVAEAGVALGGDGGADGGADRGKGIEVEGESSETTPQQTIYTKRPPGGGGATSGVVRSPHIERYPADSWGNPACDDLPHAPRWKLTQGSRMNDVNNCHEFFAMSLPPAERMFQKNRNRFSLLDDHVHAGVNFFATSQEILREWRSMGKRPLNLRSRRSRLLKRGKNLMLRRKARVASEQKEKEYVARIDKLEVLAQQKATECEDAQRLLAEKAAEVQAAELLAEETSADTRWLLSRGVPLLADRILNSTELATYMLELGRAGYNSGRKFGFAEGKSAVINKEKDYHFELYKEDCDGAYAAKRKEFSTLEFAVVRAAQKLSRKPDGVALLKKALGEDSDAAGGAGPSQT
ncbi:hypothetical protein HanLR1_Chr03g0106331 [Helianthus annuus]|nr:hypothetical protein HanLR1_Chr03g0106331 [Helianthus annuus]